MPCCNKAFKEENNLEEKLEEKLELQNAFIEKLISDNEKLKEQLKESDNQWATNIDVFVEKWFEENRDNIDIGVINFGFFKLDLFPDYLEKHIYKKVLKVVYSFIQSAIAPKIKDPKFLNI